MSEIRSIWGSSGRRLKCMDQRLDVLTEKGKFILYCVFWKVELSNNMSNILKDAEIDPSQIVDVEEDEEYLYDQRKKQEFSTITSWTRRKLRSSKNLIWCLVALALVYQIYGFFTYTTYPYFPTSYEDDNYSNLVSISYDEIQQYYHDRIDGVQWNNYAYVSYATNLNYLCSSLMMFQKLKNDYHTKADLVLFYNLEDEEGHVTRQDYATFDNTYRSIAHKLGIKLVPITSRSRTEYNVEDINFKSSYHKLEIFQFNKYKKYIGNYKKLVYVDSDIYLNDKMDELFFIPDEFDIAMPIAYWLLDPLKNYRNLLSQYPANTPRYASSRNKRLNYFRIQNKVDKNLKWSTALMVVTPSETLTDAVNEELFFRQNNDYDMDIINHVFESPQIPSSKLRKLTLPHKNYFVITGDVFLTKQNRHYFLADPIDLQFINNYSLKKCKNRLNDPYWCKTGTQEDNFLAYLNLTKMVHFSDFPLSKPWVQSYIKITCANGNHKKLSDYELKRTVVVDDCDDYNAWGHFHNMFIRDRVNVCGLHQEIEEEY